MTDERFSLMIKVWADRLESDIVLLRDRLPVSISQCTEQQPRVDPEVLARLNCLLADLRQAEILARALQTRKRTTS